MFNADSRLLVTQREFDKTSVPGAWANSVGGHPAPGESLCDAIGRCASFELGLGVEQARLVLPAFAYRAEAGGLAENEMCPDYVGLLPPPGADVSVELHGDEVEAAAWVPRARFRDEVMAGERSVCPWCRAQVGLLPELGDDPRAWPAADPRPLPAGAPPSPFLTAPCCESARVGQLVCRSAEPWLLVPSSLRNLSLTGQSELVGYVGESTRDYLKFGVSGP